MKKIEVYPGIYHLRYGSKGELASTFLRFQEYYESPKFHGKIFSRKEFIEWQRKETGQFTYLSDWNGFNIPSYILDPFYTGKFKNITKQEKVILDSFRKLWEGQQMFYIIGSSSTSSLGTMDHEVAHGLFYMNVSYNKAVHRILKNKDLGTIYRHLKELGYGANVFLDEAQAYLGHSINYLEGEGIDCKVYEKLTKRLQTLFKKHTKKY